MGQIPCQVTLISGNTYKLYLQPSAVPAKTISPPKICPRPVEYEHVTPQSDGVGMYSSQPVTFLEFPNSYQQNQNLSYNHPSQNTVYREIPVTDVPAYQNISDSNIPLQTNLELLINSNVEDAPIDIENLSEHGEFEQFTNSTILDVLGNELDTSEDEYVAESAWAGINTAVASKNPLKFDCSECGAKFDNILMLTEHNCYEEPMSNQPHVMKNGTSQEPMCLQSDSGVPQNSPTVVPQGFLKCPGCANLFTEKYFESQHQLKCSFLEKPSPRRRQQKKAKAPSEKKKPQTTEATIFLTTAKGRARKQNRTCSFCGETFTKVIEMSSHRCKYFSQPTTKCILCKALLYSYQHSKVHERSCFERRDQQLFKSFETVLKYRKTALEYLGKCKAPLVDMDPRAEDAIRRFWKIKEDKFHLSSTWK